MRDSLIGAAVRSAVEASLNLALRADPASVLKLRSLAGKSIALHITDLNLHWCVYLNDPLVLMAIESQDHPSDKPTQGDSQLTGTLQDFIGLGLKRAVSFSQTGITHSGDIQLLNTCLRIAQNLDLDIGGAISQQLGPLAGAAWDRLSQAAGQVNKNLAKAPVMFGDYLQHELQLMPSQSQLDGFTADVHVLRSAADRLAARIERLNSRLTHANLPPHV